MASRTKKLGAKAAESAQKKLAEPWLDGRIRVVQTRQAHPGCPRQTATSALLSDGGVRTETDEIVHQAITAKHNNVFLLNAQLEPFGVLHRLVARMRADLHGEVEAVLHLGRAEHHLAISNKQQAAVAQVGDQQG